MILVEISLSRSLILMLEGLGVVLVEANFMPLRHVSCLHLVASFFLFSTSTFNSFLVALASYLFQGTLNRPLVDSSNSKLSVKFS